MTKQDKFVTAASVLRAEKAATAKRMGLKTPDANALVIEGLLRDTGRTEKILTPEGLPSRGRPAKVFAFTDKGRRQAKKILA